MTRLRITSSPAPACEVRRIPRYPSSGVLRKAFADARLRVLGEVTAEYAGLTLSHPQYEAYLALAEEFNIPVALHTGTAPPGTSYDPCCRKFRVSFGNPALIEEALNRHAKLRVNLMHAAWPYLQETMALMAVYPQVYVDLGWCGWGLPRAEFYVYAAEDADAPAMTTSLAPDGSSQSRVGVRATRSTTASQSGQRMTVPMP
jgi:predicted TIM-barrel fold metal-dependent hydrolase